MHHAHLSRLPHTLGVPALQRTRPSEDTESAVHLLSSNGAWSPSPEQTEKPGISHPPKIKISPHIYRLEGHSETWPWAIRAQGAPREGRCFVIAVIMRGSNKASGFSNQSEICFCCLRFVNIGLSAGFSECFGLEVIYLELKAKSSVCPCFSLKTNNLTLNISSTPGWVIDHGFFLFISSINKQIF